uniref:Choline transporter-like protein n=1 Tax=Arion vulgaris TaxID=1028688 RepID=A0A0B7B198_9EUPU
MAKDRPAKGGVKRETSFTDAQRPTENGRNNANRETPLTKGHNPCYNGPNKNRSCTDVICCLVFIVFLAGLVVVAYFAYVYGDPKLLIYPQDSEGNLCGLGNKANKKYLFFFDLVTCGRMGPGVFIDGCPTPQVCVEQCPDTDYLYLENDRSKLICKDNVDVKTSPKSDKQLVMDNDCAAYYFKSEQVVNRCLPISRLIEFGDKFVTFKDSNGTEHNVSDSSGNPVESDAIKAGLTVYEQFLHAKEFGEKIIADVVASWWMILVGFIVAMLISLIWITLMRWIAGFMVWLTILAFAAIWIFLTGASWYLYINSRGKNESFTVYLVWRMTFEKEKLFLAAGIIFGVIMAIVLLILLFLCHRIIIAVAIIKQASRAVGAMWSTLLWPLIPFILQIGVIALWATIATYLASVGRAEDLEGNNITFLNGSFNYDAISKRSKNLFEEIPCNVNDTSELGDFCGFIKNGKGDYTIYMQIFNLFMVFWLVNFVAAMGQLTLSGAFSSWYWAFNKPNDVPYFPLLGAFWRCFRYHLGSLAFGSLLIAIVQLIRALLEYLDHKLKGSENPVASFLLKCLKCCFWCLEKVLRFLCKCLHNDGSIW